MTDVHFDPDDPFVGSLFAAGRAEAPDAEALERTLLATSAAATVLAATHMGATTAGSTLGATAGKATGGAVSAATAAHAATPIGWIAFAKWTTVGLAAGLVTLGGARGIQRAMEPHAAPAAAKIAAGPDRTSSATARVAAPVQMAPRQDSPSPEPLTPAAPAVRKMAADPERIALPQSMGRRDDALDMELSRVDSARAALDGARPAEAVAVSEQYEREHPGGRLLPEALLIRIRALRQMKRQEDARGVAERLVRLSPNSPHAAEARALLRGAP